MMGRRLPYRLSLCAVLLGLVHAPAAAGVWTNLEGLPVPQLTAVTGTDSGTVVVATIGSPDSADVWEYDGIRFRRLSARYASRPYFGAVISCLAYAPGGDLWVGTTVQGLFRLRAGGFTRFSKEDGIGGRLVDQITGLAVDAAGTVWAATNGGGLSRYDGTAWTTLRDPEDGLPSNYVNDVATAGDGAVWIALNNRPAYAGDPGGPGLARYAGGVVTPARGGPQEIGRVAVAADGRAWATAPGTGAALYAADGAFLGEYVSPDVDIDLSAVAEGQHGDIWFGSSRSGLSRFNGAGWEQYSARGGQGLANDTIRDLFLDAAGVLWVATAGGLTRYEGSLWLTFSPDTAQHALPGGRVNGLARGAAADLPSPAPVRGVTRGPLYAALGNSPTPATGGLVRISGLTAEPVRDAGGAALTGPFQAVSAAPGGAWASRTSEIFRVGGAAVTASYATPDAQDVFALLGAGDGTAWAGTRRNLLRFDGSAWAVRDLPGFAPTKIVSLATDAAGRVWAASSTAGAARLDPAGGAVELFGGAQGLPSTNLYQVFVAAGGDVWFATAAGLARLRGSAVDRVFTTADGLPSSVVLSVGEDQAGRLWVGTANGLAYAAAAGDAWTAFNTGDGLPSSVVTTLVADTSEALLGSDQNGVALFRRDGQPPHAAIVIAPAEVTSSRSAAFFFEGGDLDSQPQYLRYSWSLDGAASEPFSTETNARAAGLADGPHVFEVRARDRALNVTGSPAAYAFEVDGTPPQPVLARPVFGAVVNGVTPVVAGIREPRFQSWKVDVRPAGESDPAKNPWILLGESVEPPAPLDTLLEWDTAAFPDGVQELRVSVADTLGLIGYATVEVTVDNQAPLDAVTSPARVNSDAGGRVYTLAGEVEVYFPPRALDLDRLVSIDTLTTAPAALPPGAQQVLAAWSVAPLGFATQKPVTVTFATRFFPVALPPEGAAGGGATAAAAAPALPSVSVFALDDGGAYTFLGGNLDAAHGTLTTTTSQLGKLVVARGLFAAAADAGRALEVQPRAFSPKGGTFDDRAAISFTLGGSGGDARVSVYDRAGRLVRRVFDGLLGGGRNVVYWDGRDGNGETVPSGVYAVVVEATGDTDVASVAVVNR
jgi:ligand-binding sensor domain-containing protein